MPTYLNTVTNALETYEGSSVPDPSRLSILTLLTAAQIAAYVPPVPPNPQGFINAVKTALGGVLGIRSLSAQIVIDVMLCADTVNLGNWADLQTVIIAATTELNAANVAFYPAIKAAATVNAIPITLP